MVVTYLSPQNGLLNIMRNNTGLASAGLNLWFGVPLVALKFGLLYKVGSAILGQPNWVNGFFSGVGDLYYNEKPIVITGLVHKGEPFIGNLEGMRKGEFEGLREAIAYRFQKVFEPMEEVWAGVEGAGQTIAENLKLGSPGVGK